MQAKRPARSRMLWIIIALTLMSAGRAMTLGWILRAGDGGAGDPPSEWLMPLIGDAVVGLAAIAIASLLWSRPNPTTWAIAIAWSAVAAFDALAAYVVDLRSPWPDFFMIELFGRSMFFAAALMHVIIIRLLFTMPVRDELGVPSRVGSTPSLPVA